MRARPWWALLGGVGLGAALMYLLDADNGRRRRVVTRDRAARALRRGRRTLESTARDLSQRARGVAAGVRSRLRSGREPVPDEVLVERVRAALGHRVTHPSLIEVQVEDGRLTLSGPVLKREARRLLRGVRRVAGVKSVGDRLERLSRFEPLPAPGAAAAPA
jgi:osmotically-inducible protein OsmY